MSKRIEKYTGMVTQPAVTAAKICADTRKPRSLIGLPESLLVEKPKSQVVWMIETQKPVVEQAHLGNWNLNNL